MSRDIYNIPAGSVELIVSPLRGISAAVNASGVSALREALLRNSPLPESLNGLTAFLSDSCAEPAISKGAAQPPFLGLILTRGCNMGCRYCDFDAVKGGGDMDAELISRSIGGWAKWMAEGNGKSLDLQFFGGEPFTRFDLIEIAVHRLRFLGQKYDLPTHVEACTNGLLNGAMLGFVKDYFDAVILSLDGQARDHDPHRALRNGAGSFDGVWATAQALAQSPVELCVRCCVSALNVERIPRIAEWLCRELRPDSIVFEAMKSTPQSAAAGLRPPDPLLFVSQVLPAQDRDDELGGFAFGHLPVGERDIRLRDEASDFSGSFFYIDDPVVQVINLAAPGKFPVYRVAHKFGVIFHDICLHRLAFQRRLLEHAHVAYAGEAHMQSPGYRGRRQGKDVYV